MGVFSSCLVGHYQARETNRQVIIEASKGRLRQECLKESWFLSLDDARQKVEAWQQDFDKNRPPGSLGSLSLYMQLLR